MVHRYMVQMIKYLRVHRHKLQQIAQILNRCHSEFYYEATFNVPTVCVFLCLCVCVWEVLLNICAFGVKTADHN